MTALVGVDIGTQGTKAALFDAEGACLATAFRASNLRRPRPGHVEEDPDEQVAAVTACIAECVRKAKLGKGDVAAIAIDGQMAGVIGVGRDGRAVTPYDSWLDTRCRPYVHAMQRKAEKKVLRQTGCAPSFNHGPKILWLKHEQPKTYRKVAAFVQPGGYAAMRLCGLGGEAAFIDTTYLHFSGFARSERAVWDAKLCDEFGVDAAKLPAIVEPRQIVGELTAEMAKRCGLKAGTPVAAGCGDTAASFLAAGAVAPGICVDVAGTASVFAATTDSFKPDTEQGILATGRSVVPGLWHPYAYINGGGLNLEWFRKEVLVYGLNGSAKMKQPISLEALNEGAAKLPPSDVDSLPLFVPHLGGRVSPAQPGLRGAWVGLDWSHAAPHMHRAMLESVALEYALYKRALLGLYPRLRIRDIRVTGGGEVSNLWNQIKADVLQAPVRRVRGSQGAPRGAAMLASWAAGVLRDLPSAAATWVEADKPIRPHRNLARHYERRTDRYAELLTLLDDPDAPTDRRRDR